jgi:hypothetical protein
MDPVHRMDRCRLGLASVLIAISTACTYDVDRYRDAPFDAASAAIDGSQSIAEVALDGDVDEGPPEPHDAAATDAKGQDAGACRPPYVPCAACCDREEPDAGSSYREQLRACACGGAGACGSSCMQTFCKGGDPSLVCRQCLEVATAAGGACGDVCKGSKACARFHACNRQCLSN